MSIQKFIEKAIEGGYDAPYSWEEQSWQGDHGKLKAILDPLAWQAVGKVEGWDKSVSESNCNVCGEPMPEGETMFMFHGYSGDCPKPPMKQQFWKQNMHRMIDHLAEGGTIESYLKTL